MSLQDLIPIVNRLQDIVTNTNLTDLDLPLLTVIGSQSAGKSSVLENIVGKDFLPRGTGIVTRRPLILQLINLNESNESLIDENADQKFKQNGDEFTLEDHLKENSNNEWGEFLHIPGKRFYNFNDIRKEIENETARIAGKNKGISRLPINLKVYSPNVLNLTMVDLPGLTKIPIGDQPTDIERQIKNLILEYIAKPNSIILAVSPANVDLVNSESLKLARQVDPQGKRTVGVLSKIDLMDQGTNALDILTGKVYPLKLGFIGIVNRSQQDIAVNKSLSDSLRSEEEFFHNHPAYRSIAAKCGTKYLAKTLNQTLMHHIREKLPDIKAKLNTLMGQTEQELASYGDAGSIATENKGVLILQLMTRFATNFVNSIEGTAVDISTKELCGGARIYYIYNEVFGQSLLTINPTSNLTVNDIRTAIRNSTGPRPSLFVPELAFDLLVKPQIQLLEGPSKRCVELVYEELMKICHNSGSVELDRYPKLQTKLIEVVSELLRERLGPTSKYVESLIEIHRAYINTNHPNFVGAASAMASVVEERQKSKQVQAAPLVENHSLKNGTKEKEEEVVELHSHTKSKHSISQQLQLLQQLQQQLQLQTSPKNEHSLSTNGSAGSKQEDSFLNFFFGKDQATQEVAVLDEEPSFPSLETNLDLSMKITQNMDKLKLREQEEVNSELSEREQMECELIRRLIISYFSIVREMIQDQVPKLVMCLLVNYIKESIQNRLVSKLYKDELFDDLLYEDEAISAERKRCEKLLATYREASEIISEVI